MKESIVVTSSSTDWVDWEKTIKQHKNKKFAQSLLGLFSTELPKLQAQMKEDYQQNRLKALTRTIHHIHGSCCFCVAPRLESYSAKFQHQLETQDYSKLKERVGELDTIINNVLACVKSYLRSLNKKESKNV
jgi:two-component system sensor histidine kinase BarA